MINKFVLVMWSIVFLLSCRNVLMTVNEEATARRREREGSRYRFKVVRDYALVPLSAAVILLTLWQIYNPSEGS